MRYIYYLRNLHERFETKMEKKDVYKIFHFKFHPFELNSAWLNASRIIYIYMKIKAELVFYHSLLHNKKSNQHAIYIILKRKTMHMIQWGIRFTHTVDIICVTLKFKRHDNHTNICFDSKWILFMIFVNIGYYTCILPEIHTRK